MMNQASSLSLMLAGVLALLIGYRELLAVVGTGAFLATALLIAGVLATGFLLTRGGPANRSVMARGSATCPRLCSLRPPISPILK